MAVNIIKEEIYGEVAISLAPFYFICGVPATSLFNSYNGLQEYNLRAKTKGKIYASQ